MAKLGDVATNVLAVISVACAVTVTVVAVRGQTARRGTAAPQPRHVSNWREYAAVGHRMGSAAAPVTITEFADFQCPVCRQFTLGALASIRREYGNRVAVVYRYWPLSMHPLAYPAARAAECAAAQGRFEAFHDLIYAKQDSLGLKSFASFARDAGVPDSTAFAACDFKLGPVAVVERDIAAVEALGGTGTPTLLVNDLVLPGAADSARFDQYVRSALRAAGAATP